MDECQLPTRKDLGLQFDRGEGVQYKWQEGNVCGAPDVGVLQQW